MALETVFGAVVVVVGEEASSHAVEGQDLYLGVQGRVGDTVEERWSHRLEAQVTLATAHTTP